VPAEVKAEAERIDGFIKGREGKSDELVIVNNLVKHYYKNQA